MSGPSVSRCFRVWDVFVSIFFLHVNSCHSSHLVTPGISQDETCELIEPYLRLGAHPVFSRFFHLPPATVIWIYLDQGVDADPAKSWGPWKHAVWRTEDIAEASNLVDLYSHLFAFVDHFRTRLDQSMAKKANAAAEGLCKFVFWTAKRCEFEKSHTCDLMSPLSKL